jgi:hypothetical protein
MRTESKPVLVPIAHQSPVTTKKPVSPAKSRLASPEKANNHPTSSGKKKKDVLAAMFEWLNEVPTLYDESSLRLPIAHEAECVSEDEDMEL